MPFDPLLFFGEAGNGDLFAFLARIDRPDVVVWNHELDSRTWVAPSLTTYLDWRLSGRIELSCRPARLPPGPGPDQRP
ncbi:SMI1/KNR4 family protein [Streptomyces laurentii]|uniref:SMI1/KNR4 family protein n=1 Tax=Streptomyces laurentii TaxID=39478 RepID=A0A169NT10_STRLU|nr:SMI1/KNR4 family protein [Streptomyces laurentii]